MGSKRKSGGMVRGEASVSKRLHSAAPVRMPLRPGEVITVTGEGTAAILSGAVRLSGKICSAGEALAICADDGPYGPVVVEALPTVSEVQVPYSADDAVQLELGPLEEAGGGGASTQAWPSAPLQQTPTTAGWPSQWQQVADDVAAAARAGQPVSVAVCGTKGTGKSTFARLMVNSLLNVCPRVAFLDTDSGQPELTPPGLVSWHLLEAPMLGRPHTHQHMPTRSVFLGELSCAGDPSRYVEAVCHLHSSLLTCSADLAGPTPLPLVINTAGWIKGLGFDVLAAILRHTAPSHVVTLATCIASKDLPQGCQPRLPSGPDKRALLWHTFGQACCQHHFRPVLSPDTATFAWLAKALAAQQPYSIAMDSLRCRVVHDSCMPAAAMPSALNGAIVGLIAAQAQRAGSSLQSEPRDACADCLGLGLVRAVDCGSGLLYLLTPLPEEQLQQVNELHVGRLELPAQLLHTSVMQSPYLSPWCIGNVGTGAARMHPRTDLVRTRQTVV